MSKTARALTALLVLLQASLYAQEKLYIQQAGAVEAFKGPIFRGASTSSLIALTSTDKSVKLFDAATSKERFTLTSFSSRVASLEFTASGQSLVIATGDGQVTTWTSSTGVMQESFSGPSTFLSFAVQGDNLVYVLGPEKSVKAFDLTTGKSPGSMSSRDELTALALHPNGKFFVVSSASGEVRFCSTAQMAVTNTLTDANERISALLFSQDGRFLVGAGTSGTLYVWDAAGLTLKAKLTGHRGGITSIAIDPKVRWLASAAYDSTLRFYSLTKFAPMNVIPEPDAYIGYTSFINDELFITGDSKGIIKTWKVFEVPPDTTPPAVLSLQPPTITGTKVFGQEYEIRGVAYDDGELKDVLVQGKPASMGQLSADETARIPQGVKGKRFTALVKLDATGPNRIEIVATDKAEHVTKQTLTIQRLTNDEALEILTPRNNAETDKVSVQVEIKPWFDVASYTISVNYNEIVTNIYADKRAGEVIKEEAPLVVGYNPVLITVKSKAGEKFSKTLAVTRKTSFSGSSLPMVSGSGAAKSGQPGTVGPQRWAVIVGLSEYSNPAVTKLQYADRDAEALASFLKRPEGGGIDSDHMRVLINKDATLANVQDALINFLGQAIDIDLVFIYFAGHGAPEPARPANTFLLTYDADPNRLATTAFPMFQIKDVLERYLTSKKIVVFSDACHSGGISVDYATRGLALTDQNLFNQYLADLAKTRPGTIIFTASAANEVSQEFPDLSHGVFTYFLLKGMEGEADLDNDYTVTINELMQYVEEQVKRKTKGAQNPTRSQTNYDKNLPISYIPH